MKYSEAKQGRVFVIRLEDGDVVHEVIEAFAAEHSITAATLIAVGGADDGSRLVVGPAEDRASPVVPMQTSLSHAHEVAGVPEPLDPAITIRAVPSRKVATVRYGGGWSEKRYHAHLARLESWMGKAKLEAAGEPVWARYNGPFTPWFLRRNEILIPIKHFPVQSVDG